MDKKRGVYIHVPFCIRKCRYCDFPSFEDREHIDSYFKALITEIRDEKETAGRITDTIYIGGGTPSCVPPLYISSVMEALSKTYVIEDDAEISMEMNPGTVDPGALKVYRSAGINRVSLGCQSFNDKSLRTLGRIHSSDDIRNTFEKLRDAGFDNINLDLISSLPGESGTDMERSLRKAAALSPEHISVYSLIIEEGTVFHELSMKNELKGLPDEEEQAETDLMVRTVLKDFGYSRYEISNYAKEGFECRHNIRYWKREDYRGFGLSAASLIGNRRFTNTRKMVYINQPGGSFEEDRTLSRKEEMEEFMFLGLRMTEGVSADDFLRYFGRDITEVYGGQLKEQMADGFLEYNGKRYFYNDRGLDVSNILLSAFLF
ncbi:MAG: radical SAM family heme chaperone HemW [Lachnospiraceae bacterium]|nr:radical SAM family heme chaperone HemW [Lachnospiraceae bacterium]